MLSNKKDYEEPLLTGKIVTGTVVFNADPLHLGRVKVRVPELHPKDLADEYLPWVESWQFRSSVNSQGNINVPDIGSKCRIMYPSDDVYSGVYITAIPNVKEELLEDYPFTYGFIDRSGSLFAVNTKTDVYTLYHVTGTKLTIDGNGHCIVQATSNSGNGESLSESVLDIQIVGNAKIEVQDDFNIKATTINMEAKTINVKSSKYENSSSSTLIQSGGAMNINGGGSSLNLTGSPVLDGKDFGIYEDTCEGSVIEQFYAFSTSGSPTTGTAPSVPNPQIQAPAARKRQASQG